jgi:hypothetical protein
LKDRLQSTRKRPFPKRTIAPTLEPCILEKKPDRGAEHPPQLDHICEEELRLVLQQSEGLVRHPDKGVAPDDLGQPLVHPGVDLLQQLLDARQFRRLGRNRRVPALPDVPPEKGNVTEEGLLLKKYKACVPEIPG